jgi:hypothetical protein
MTRETALVPAEKIAAVIRVLRGQRVILDSDLAALYGVETRALNQAAKRNRERFPEAFMFQLTAEEQDLLRSQIVISKGKGGRRFRPFAFTEHGVLMAANVLNSALAVSMSVQIVETFVRMRQILGSYSDLARKLAAMEKRYDSQFKVVFDAIRQLMTPPEPKRKTIGFQTGK